MHIGGAHSFLEKKEGISDVIGAEKTVKSKSL